MTTEETLEDEPIEKLKKVHFYGLAVRHGASYEKGQPEDWPGQLTRHLATEAKDRIIQRDDGLKIVAQAVDRQDQVGVGRVIDDTGLQLANLANETFTPVFPESADEYFTRVTYLQFIHECNAIAVIGGAAGRPSKHVVQVFLNEICPLVEGAKWVCRELYTAGQIDQLGGVPGIEKMTFVSDAMPADLTTLDFDKASDLGQLRTALATLFDGEIRVKLEVKVKRPGHQDSVTRRVRDWVTRSIPYIPQAEKMSVKTTGLESEVLELVKHRLSAHVPLPQGRLTGKELQDDILANLSVVCHDWQNRVKEAVDAM